MDIKCLSINSVCPNYSNYIHSNYILHLITCVCMAGFLCCLPETITTLFISYVLCLVTQTCPTLQPHGLKPTRLLCPWGFSSQEYWSGLPCPPPGDLPNPGLLHFRQIFYSSATWEAHSSAILQYKIKSLINKKLRCRDYM